jgi:two-component system response regulator GlrR
VIPETLVENALPFAGTHKTKNLTDAKRDFERNYVEELLRSTGGSITEAARLAGRNRSDFYKIVQRHGVEVERFKTGLINE